MRGTAVVWLNDSWRRATVLITSMQMAYIWAHHSSHIIQLYIACHNDRGA